MSGTLSDPLEEAVIGLARAIVVSTNRVTQGPAYGYGAEVRSDPTAFIVALRRRLEAWSTLTVRLAADSLVNSVATPKPASDALMRLVVCDRGKPEGVVRALQGRDTLCEITAYPEGLALTFLHVALG